MNALEQMIYLDHQATTPVDPRVFAKMQPYFLTDFGNASSSQHAFGWSAQKAVETARSQVATLIGAQGREITFTSGATESINWVFHGLAELASTQPVHVITSNAEHSATIGALESAQKRGVNVTVLPVNSVGAVSVEQVRQALTPTTRLVSLIYANNEIGTLNPIAEIGRLTRERGIWLHTDGTQAVGKLAVDVNALNIDLLSISGHKLYGPKGIGALYMRAQNPRIQLPPFICGGGQERGRRAGTLNVPGIVGLGAACEIARQEFESEAQRLTELRRFLQKELSQLEGVTFNGDLEVRLPGNLSVTFADAPSSELYPYLQNIAISTGSACASEGAKPSHVLTAIGLTEQQARCTFRLGLGRSTTLEQCQRVVSSFASGIGKIRDNLKT
jgi:cysteine desulfurase